MSADIAERTGRRNTHYVNQSVFSPQSFAFKVSSQIS